MRTSLFLILFLFLFSCKEKKYTPSGYEYIFYKNKEGAQPKVGDQVVFHEKQFLNGKEVSSTYGASVKKIILPQKEILTQPFPPTYEVLFEMSEGDSVVIKQSLKEIPDLPAGYTHNDVLTYAIKLITITPKEDITKK